MVVLDAVIGLGPCSESLSSGSLQRFHCAVTFCWITGCQVGADVRLHGKACCTVQGRKLQHAWSLIVFVL